MKAPALPCTAGCEEHKDGQPTHIGKHEFAVLTKTTEHGWGWVWKCACGGVGRWQYQSGSVSYHQWLKHVEKRG